MLTRDFCLVCGSVTPFKLVQHNNQPQCLDCLDWSQTISIHNPHVFFM